MDVKWSPHAEELLDGIVIGIATALSIDDGLAWESKLRAASDQLADFPYLGTEIPLVCFHTVPANVERLRQIICKPYRIVYEPVEDEIHVLSIRHARMLIAEDDTDWS